MATAFQLALRRPPLLGLLLLVLTGLSHGVQQQLFACGLNSQGQLGTGDTGNKYTLMQLTGLSSPWWPANVTGIASGTYHSIMIGNNRVYTTGYNSAGQLGRSDVGNGQQIVTPWIIGGTDATWGFGAFIGLVAAGDQHSMVLAGGQVYGFGDNTYGQLGLGTTTTSFYTAQLLNGTNAPWGKLTVTALTAGSAHTLILAGGRAYVTGILGTTKTTSPVALAVAWGSASVTAIVSGLQHAFVLAGGQAYAMGLGTYGQLGLGSNTQFTSSPALLSGPWGNATVTLVAAGSFHSIVVAGGRLYAFGANDRGQLGLVNVSGLVYTPTLLNYTMPWGNGYISALVAGQAHNALIAGGALYTWGDNTYGQLGLGNTQQYGVPMLVTVTPWLPATIGQVQARLTRTFVIADPIPAPSPSPQSPDPSPLPNAAPRLTPSAVLLLLGSVLCSYLW